MRSCDGPRSAMGRLLGTFAICKVVVDRWDGGEGADLSHDIFGRVVAVWIKSSILCG